MVDVAVVDRVEEGDDGLGRGVLKVEMERVESTDVARMSAWAWLEGCGGVVASSLSNQEEETLRVCRLGASQEAKLRGVAI